MVISSVEEQALSGLLKITVLPESVFFIRTEYLQAVSPEKIIPGAEFCGADEDEIVEAGIVTAAEFKAMDYLSRAEQCRFRLSAKLAEKGFEPRHIKPALDYLESDGSLSDARFARAWLGSRRINHFEGRTKLLALLLQRGISSDTAAAAVAEFFEENDELEICRRAYERFVRQGKEGDRLDAAMRSAGFSFRTVRDALDGASV